MKKSHSPRRPEKLDLHVALFLDELDLKIRKIHMYKCPVIILVAVVYGKKVRATTVDEGKKKKTQNGRTLFERNFPASSCYFA